MPQLRGQVKGLSREHFQMSSIGGGKRLARPWPRTTTFGCCPGAAEQRGPAQGVPISCEIGAKYVMLQHHPSEESPSLGVEEDKYEMGELGLLRLRGPPAILGYPARKVKKAVRAWHPQSVLLFL